MEDLTYEAYRDEWMRDVKAEGHSTLELGRRFSHKLLAQLFDVDEGSTDIVYCDGSGDGGIDVAYLQRGEGAEGEDSIQGDIWYLVQSKYGSAFRGTDTLLQEGQKVIDTLDGKRTRLSSLAEGLLERLTNFRGQVSERDRIVLLFATTDSLSAEERRAMIDVRAMGRTRLGTNFDVEAVSVRTIFDRIVEEEVAHKHIRVPLRANVVPSEEDLLIGSTSLLDLYSFLKAYRDETGDLDQLYEKNVRRFLGLRGRVNRAIQETLNQFPERFGLYNNGITIVVNDFEHNDGSVVLIDPFVVNGCQTTRTIWEVSHRRLEAGGTGRSDELEEWRRRAGQGVVVTKIVKVGSQGEALLESITRYTNTQNAIREKDFLALTKDFKAWARQMEDDHGVFLEIQRGGWESRKALQQQKPSLRQLDEAANAFDLLKVYASGWLGEAGLAYGKNAPFLPNGSVFKKVMDGDGSAGDLAFGVEDLYTAYRLRHAADNFGFGRGAEKPSRRQSRFLFYMVAMEILRDVVIRSTNRPAPPTRRELTGALQRLCASPDGEGLRVLLETAVEAVDTYLTQGEDDSVFKEPAFLNAFNSDLNGFMKWEKLGKSETDCPRFRSLVAVTKATMGRRSGNQLSPRDLIAAIIKEEPSSPNPPPAE